MENAKTAFELNYAGRFFDSADQVVVLMYALAFAFYYVASQHLLVRDLIQKYYKQLLVMAIMGLVGTLVLVTRLWVHEWQLISTAYQLPAFNFWTPMRTFLLDSSNCGSLCHVSKSALEIRELLLIVNFGIYVFVLSKVRSDHVPSGERPQILVKQG